MKPFAVVLKRSSVGNLFGAKWLRHARQPAWLLLAALTLAVDATATPAEEPPQPVTPRDYYNSGTRLLNAGKLREAEVSFETSLASQQASLQPPALYNLGHVRFKQGVEELKKGPGAGPALQRGRNSEKAAGDAIQAADEALAGDDVQKMVEAYQRGKGVRKELKAAKEAVRVALEAHGAALHKWQRSLGDFKSTLELKTNDSDAQHNADVLDRCIARLIDSVRQMQQCSNGMGSKESELSKKLKNLKGKIPGSQMPPGAAGEEEEEEDQPFGPKPGQKEAPSREGKEMPLTAEMAGWLLQGFKLDAERRLPMGVTRKAQPKDRSGSTW
jgi:hypothetical protein